MEVVWQKRHSIPPAIHPVPVCDGDLVETFMNIPANHGPRPSDEQLEKLSTLDVCTVCHVLVDLGYANTFLRGIPPLCFPESRESFVGFARTLRFVPLREDLVKAQYADNLRSPHRTALEGIREGDVLVIDTGGCLESAVVGDIFTRRVKVLGGRAIVIDGVIRDLGLVQAADFPVFAKGVHGAGINRYQMSAGVDEIVVLGGVTILPGDVIYGNRDGVIAVPPHMVQPVIEHMEGKLELESWIREKIHAGGDLHRYYQHPPTQEVLEEFALSKKNGSLITA